MSRLAIWKRSDIGTILLHWLVVITLTTSVATGLRIAADEPEHAWLLVFDRLLPKQVVWTGHMPAALILCTLAVAYVAYLISSQLFRRVQLDHVRLAGLFKGGQARWSAINILLCWVFFTAIVAEIVTGLSARELRYIAARHSSGIGPRWRYSTEWWGALLVDGQVSLQTTRFDTEAADVCRCGADESFFAAPQTPRIRLRS